MKIKKVYVDVLTALAKGTDAGIYRLNPKRVEIVSCEQDVKRNCQFFSGRLKLGGPLYPARLLQILY